VTTPWETLPQSQTQSIKAGIQFRKSSRTLEELIAGKKPFTSWEDLDIPDLTDEERDAFAAE